MGKKWQKWAKKVMKSGLYDSYYENFTLLMFEECDQIKRTTLLTEKQFFCQFKSLFPPKISDTNLSTFLFFFFLYTVIKNLHYHFLDPRPYFSELFDNFRIKKWSVFLEKSLIWQFEWSFDHFSILYTRNSELEK